MKKTQYVIVRTYSAGCFAGTLISRSREGKEVTLEQARRLWYWSGAASLSELATKGTSQPQRCKFPEPVQQIVLTEAIEIIATTAAAEGSIKKVPIWTGR